MNKNESFLDFINKQVTWIKNKIFLNNSAYSYSLAVNWPLSQSYVSVRSEFVVSLSFRLSTVDNTLQKIVSPVVSLLLLLSIL